MYQVKVVFSTGIQFACGSSLCSDEAALLWDLSPCGVYSFGTGQLSQ